MVYFLMKRKSFVKNILLVNNNSISAILLILYMYIDTGRPFILEMKSDIFFRFTKYKLDTGDDEILLIL